MSVTLDDDEETVLGLRPDGRPDPDYAKELGLVPASAGLRSLGFAIDAVIVVLLTLPLSLGALPIWLGLVFAEPTPNLSSILSDPAFITGLILYAIGQGTLSIFVLVQIILHGIKGVTVGKAIVGIRSVNAARFTKPGFWRILIRAVVFWSALAIIPILGAIPFLLSPLWDRERRGRGWLDRIGGNWLIDVRRGLDPFDRKALRHARKRVATPEVGAQSRMPSLATGTAGAVPSFLPAGRSNSGVVSARPDGHPVADGWQPPLVGAAVAPALRPASSRAVPAPTAPITAPVTPAPTAPAPTAPEPAAPKAAAPKAALIAAAPNAAAPNAAAPRAPAATSPSVSAVLGFDDGMRVAVLGNGLIGRKPEARTDESIEHFVAVDDDSRQISKTHVEFGVDDHGFWLIDRGSVNGTMIRCQGQAPRELVPWQRERIEWNSSVEVGGRRFTVTSGTNQLNGHA